MISFAFEFVMTIVVWIIIGYTLSNYYHNNIFIVVGFFIGIVMAFLKIVKLIDNWKYKNKRKK